MDPLAWGLVVSGAIVLLLTPVTEWLAPKIGGVDSGGDRPRVQRSPCPASARPGVVIGISWPARCSWTRQSLIGHLIVKAGRGAP